MRILYVVAGTSLSDGSTKSFLSVLRAADRAQISYEVVCPDKGGLTSYLKNKGVRVHVVDYRHVRIPPTQGIINKLKLIPRLIHDSLINLKARTKVTSIAREFSPDIIHENSSAIDVGFHAAKKTGVPDIIHIRELGDLKFLKIIGRKHRLSAPFVYPISITRQLAHYTKQDKNPNGVQIYNGIISTSEIRYNQKKKPYFLYAGRIEESKGVTELIKAYAKYAKSIHNPLKLLMAGDCNYPSYINGLRNIIKKDNLGDLIVWLGGRDDVYDLMYDATATIIPSRYEALGRIMPEASANGCLCIAVDSGGVGEQLNIGKEFIGEEIAIPFNSIEDLTSSLCTVTENARTSKPFEKGGLYEKMIRDSQKTVAEFFSEAQFGQNLIAFYNSIKCKQGHQYGC